MVKQVHDHKGVPSEDIRFKVEDVIADLAKEYKDEQIITLAWVAIGPGGEVKVGSSTGTPQTLNLLAQGTKVADGTYDKEDES